MQQVQHQPLIVSIKRKTSYHVLDDKLFLEAAKELLNDQFPQSLYSKIEDFLDKENLFISTCSPILTWATLKPSLDIKQYGSFNTLPAINAPLADGSPETSSMNHNRRFAMPLFLQRRTSSMEHITRPDES